MQDRQIDRQKYIVKDRQVKIYIYTLHGQINVCIADTQQTKRKILINNQIDINITMYDILMYRQIK